MTAAEFARVLLRRWWFATALLFLCVPVLLAASHPRPVYWARVTAMVITPISQTRNLTLENQGSDSTPTASVLAMLVNNGTVTPRAASPDSTLYGEGHTQAVSARVRNIGGQWQPQFRDALIDVEVVDPDPGRASANMQTEIKKLQTELTNVQDDLKVAPRSRLTLTVSPANPTVLEIPPSRSRAMVTLALLLLAGCLFVIYWFDAYMRTRERSTEPVPATSLARGDLLGRVGV